MIKLVVEGTEQFRRIRSVGVEEMDYVLEPGQELRLISDWGGRRKNDCHWDEIKQAIVDAPYPYLTDEEKAFAEGKKPSTTNVTQKLETRIEQLEERLRLAGI